MTTTDTHEDPTGQAHTPGVFELLEAAETQLCRTAQDAFDGDRYDTGHRYERLANVVDHTRRMVIPTADDHYRLEKSGVLAWHALQLELACLRDYLPDSDLHGRVQLHLSIAHHVDQVHEKLRRVAVGNALDRLNSDDAGELLAAVESLAGFARGLVELGLPAPEGC